MAKSVRSRRTVIAAGTLSLALVAPFVSPVQAQETTTPTSDAEPAPAEQPSTSEGTSAATFEPRFDTANFWNTDEAVVEGLQLQPGDTVAPRTNTIFNWGFNNNDGTLTLIRPKSTAAFGAGKKDIPVRVTTAAGETFDTTLRVNIINERPGAEWENQLTSRYPMDFEKSTSAQSVEGITLPEGVSVSKSGAALPTGWSVSNDGTTIRVTPPTTFKEGDFDLPIEVNDGTDTFKTTLKIAAKNPSKTPAETAGTVASILGPILGSLIGAGTGGNLIGGLGDIIGGLTGGNGGGNTGNQSGTSGNQGGTSGDGAGRLINVVITNNANPSNIGNNNGSPNVVITDNVNPRDNLSNNGNPVITGNANPTVEIKDNLSNNANPTVVITGNANPVITGNANENGSNNSAVVTNNANPSNNGSNNSAVVTGNANPSVVVTGNANPSVVVTGNANENGSNNSAVVTNNANPSNNGSNNSAVVTGNANPSVVVTGNANDNGSNNSAVVTNNANPSNNGSNNSAVVTNNANPSNNGSNNSAVVTNNANPSNNGSNNSAVVTGNANPSNNGSNNSAVVTGNANPSNNGSNNSVVATGNANAEVLVTGNANGGLVGFGSSRKRQDENGDHLIDANVGVDGGSSDPRCIASLVGLGLPLVALIPLALASQVYVPGLSDTAQRAERAFNDAARQFNIEPAQVTAAGGATVGVVAALLVTAAVRTCIPRVNGVDVTVGGSSNGNNKPVATVAAPVVETRQS
ncbi:hypothetical protein [Corynebacterium fournieri]|uniref:hypothetical protein n=1 Tax=Corynebacterium fournieri TaxID=1852390 RepID=UPI000A2F6479|nr:hypothetical protein [Corynebacterium fournieri]